MGSGTVTAADWAPITEAIEAQVNVSTIVAVLASVVTACIALVFMWWGIRKVTRAIMAAFKRGKLRL